MKTRQATDVIIMRIQKSLLSVFLTANAETIAAATRKSAETPKITRFLPLMNSHLPVENKVLFFNL
jgi:hypothetical protein